MKVQKIELPRNKKEQLKIINETQNNILYFRPKGFPSGATFKYNNVILEEVFVDIPTGLKGTGMRTKKEYAFYFQDGSYEVWTDPVFIKLEQII